VFAGLARGALGPAEPLLEALLRAAAGAARFSRYERVCLENLELALGAETTEAERARIARLVRAHAAKVLLEWARLARAAGSNSDRRRVLGWLEQAVLTDESLERARAIHGQGRGLLIVTAHLGNWELLAARMRQLGFEGGVVAFRRPRDPSYEWLARMRAALGVETIAQTAPARSALGLLRGGGTLGLLADLRAKRIAGVELPFFARPALTMTAPAALARATGLPLLPARCVWDGEHYRLSFGEPLELDRNLERRAAAAELAARLNRVFERWIRAHPEQWAWHQRRWLPAERESRPARAGSSSGARR
jgi:KDO2-lipid IV(A) lauroyltransferase